MSDKCTKCDGTGLIVSSLIGNKPVIEMTNCPDCHGLGRAGE